MSSPKEKENLKERENLKTVIERYEKVIEKLEIQRIKKNKKTKGTRNKKKELEELEIEIINETIANIPKEILLTYF